MSNNSSDMVRIYLQEIARIPLLTAEEEIALSRQVQQAIALEKQQQNLAQQLERQPTKTELAAAVNKSEIEVEQIIDRGQKAKQKMIAANLRLVVSIAKKYQKRNMEFMDLVQEGALGLQRGVEKFDPNRGYKLSTYAYWWITQSITRAIAEKTRTIRLPIHITEKLNQLKKAQRELSQQLGRRANVVELAEEMREKPDKIRELLGFCRQPTSLDRKVGEALETDLGELLPDDRLDPDERIAREMLSWQLDEVLATLSPRQREVLTLYFGLDGDRTLNLAEIGKRINLSREGVRQIHKKAMNILRAQEPGLRQYL